MGDKIKFKPIWGSSNNVQDSAKIAGQLFFETDTGKIYLDIDEETRKLMGGSSSGASLYYSWQGAEGDEIQKSEENENYYLLKADQISLEDADAKLEADDLIIGADGAFYRIITQSTSGDYLCVRMAISGSGDGSGPVVIEDTRLLRTESWKQNLTFIYGQDYFIEIGAESDVDDYIDLGFLVTQNNVQVESFTVSIASGTYYRFNTARLPKGTGISIQVQATSINSKMSAGPKNTITNLTTAELIVNKSANFNTSTIVTGDLNLIFLPKSNGLYQRLHVIIDGDELDLNSIQQDRIFLNFKPTNSDTTVIIPAQSHGVHNIELYTTVEISGNTLKSDSLFYEIAWRETASEDPLIWVGEVPSLVINYNEAIIPFMVYNPQTELDNQKTDVYLYYSEDGGVNFTELPTSPMQVMYNANEWHQWDVTNIYKAEEGAGKQNIFRLEVGGVVRDVHIWVTTDGSRDLGLINENALIINLNSVGRSNSETSLSRTNWAFNSHVVEFNNFNWYNNGWLNNNDGLGSYLSVANGASAKLNVGDLVLNGSADYSFEVRFRVRNIQEYSTLIRTIPYYFVEENDGSYTVADIKANNYTTKKDSDGNPIMDTQASRKEISQSAGIVMKYLNSAGQGFCIGTQEAYFNTPGNIANVRYKEDEIINLSFVVSRSSHLLSIYLNGILSGALDLSSVTSFSMTENDYIEINSEYCDIDIFKIRVYRAELSMPDVIHNYISDIHDINLYDQNQLTADADGTILLYSKLLEYNENNPNNLSMPYAVWEIIDNGVDEAGNAIVDPNKAPHGSDDDKLPFKKGNNRFAKITFVNPVLDAALDAGTISEEFYYTHAPSYVGIGVDINVQGTSSQAYPRRNFKTKFKSTDKKKDGAGTTHADWGWFYTKGSKAGQHFKKWNMDNEYCATNKFTWKIDYMESSGTYNTGFANLVGNNMYDYHPLSKYPFEEDGTGYRTSVYGFPVMVFQKHSTSADKALNEDEEYLAYEYIGRYNLNLDKSANEFYGFEIDESHPYKDDEPVAFVAECWELRDNQGTWTSFKYPTSSDRATGFATETAAGTLEVVKHFEPRYNCESDQIEFCTGAATAAELGYTDTTAVPRADGESTIDLSTQAAKNDYLKTKMANLEALFNWLDSTDRDAATNAPITPVTYQKTVYYMVENVAVSDTETVAWYVDAQGNQLVKVSDVVDVDSSNYFVYMVDGENIMERALAADNYTGTKRPKSDILVTYTTDSAEYRLRKYVAEFNQHLDLEYCLIYFILTELLLCYDSRGKNMMIATWGPETNGGNYIWFPIFYDIDTQLGLNNIGAVLWDYDTDATADGTFSTANSVLWQNFFLGFRTEIEEKYRALRKGSRLTEKTIEGAYLCDPDVFKNSYAMRGIRPVIALGLDEWYKYIAPGINKNPSWYSGTDRRFGFYVDSVDNGNTKTTDASYVYTCQGDRKLSRELFIRNRLNYLDSWWLAGAYDSTSSGYKTEIMIRANANDLTTSDSYLDVSKVTSDVTGYTRTQYPKEFYDAVPQFTIRPFLSQYVTVFYDEDPITPTIKYDGINPVITNTTPSVESGYRATHPYNEQLTYIPGGDYLSDIGDISLKYPSHFKLNTGKRLIQLLIGGDAPNYFNGIIGKEAGTFDLNDSSNSTNKKGLLQKIVLTGLTALNQAQDVSGSEKLREFRALNTQIPYVIFADGTPLDTVHLPITATNIKLVYARNMKNILTSTPQVMVADGSTYVYNDRDNYTGLYIEGLTDLDKSQAASSLSKVDTIDLQNVALGYDSYKLLDNATAIREAARPTGYLAINLENVEWSSYVPIEDDVDYDDQKTFYRLTDHNDFEVYNHTSAAEWRSLKLNDKIYVKEVNDKDNYITDLSLLDTFIEDYNRATGLANNHYRNTRGSETVTKPNITGVMYVKNAGGTAIDELELQDTYKAFFPDLTIFADNIAHSYITKYVQILDNGREQVIDLFREHPVEGGRPTLTSKVPSKINYRFKGWALDTEGTKMVFNYEFNNGWGLVDGDSVDDAGAIFGSANQTITLYAIFEIEKYGIKFMDGDGSLLTEEGGAVTYVSPSGQTDLVTKLISHGSYLELPKTTAYKDDSELEREETYILKGWSDTAGGAIIENLSSQQVQSNMVLYPVFEIGNVHDNPLDESFFDTVQSDFNYTLPGYYTANESGVALKLKAGYTVRGKITFPKSANGVKVRGIASANSSSNGFSGNSNITGIFWETGATPETYLVSSFASCSNLAYVEIPASMRSIRTQAFINCYSIVDRDFSSAINLYNVETSAFNAAFKTVTGENQVILPGSIVQLGAHAFSYNESAINVWQLGTEENGSKLTSIISSNSDPFVWNWDPGYSFIIYLKNLGDISNEPWVSYSNSKQNIEWRQAQA